MGELMPVVDIKVWKGIDQEKLEYLIKNITQSFVDIDVPAGAVHVIIQEIPKEHWGLGGKTCAVRFKDRGPQN